MAWTPPASRRSIAALEESAAAQSKQLQRVLGKGGFAKPTSPLPTMSPLSQTTQISAKRQNCGNKDKNFGRNNNNGCPRPNFQHPFLDVLQRRRWNTPKIFWGGPPPTERSPDHDDNEHVVVYRISTSHPTTPPPVPRLPPLILPNTLSPDTTLPPHTTPTTLPTSPSLPPHPTPTPPLHNPTTPHHSTTPLPRHPTTPPPYYPTTLLPHPVYRISNIGFDIRYTFQRSMSY